MGYLRRLDNNADPQAFPGTNFELTDEVPAPQCSEAQIEGTNGVTRSAFMDLTEASKFAGWDLNGKKCTITATVGGNLGTFSINGNTDDTIDLIGNPGDGVNVEYYIHNGGELILTRNVHSFAAYIHAAGYAYTIKGGKLYTNMPSGHLKNACTILFDPLT
ncbi:hypothetical protein ES703_53535 [subsurface metagenome]